MKNKNKQFMALLSEELKPEQLKSVKGGDHSPHDLVTPDEFSGSRRYKKTLPTK